MLRSFSHRILISLALFSFIAGCGGSGTSSDMAKPAPILPMSGADISFLPQLESRDTDFTENGVITPLLDILKNNGVNWIRLRLWADPSGNGGGAVLHRPSLLRNG